MQIKFNELLSSTRWSIIYIILILLFICTFVAWNTFQRIDEFEKSHIQIAKSTTEIVASEISKRIKTQQRLLRNFAKNEEKLIHQLSLDPENEKIKARLDSRVADYFPNYFAVAIADHSGNLIIDDFDGDVGELCLQDIKHYAQGSAQPVRVHPNLQVYHFDITVPWNHPTGKQEDNNSGGFLFVSFKPTFLFQLLRLSSVPQHELMLINKNLKNLIEITEKGTRDQLNRDDYHLTSEEEKRKLYSTEVENSVWNLVDFRDETLFSNYRTNIINDSLMIHVLFLIISILMIILLLRVEKTRLASEKMKEEMFSLFNHDLRAPLSSIFGFLEIFVDSSLCEKEPEKCKQIGKRAFDNALTMLDIVDDILDVQKMESGKMSFDFTEIELISVVTDAVDMSRQNGEMSNVTLELVCQDRAIYISADARRIKQAVTNLLSNAIKYSPENETVKITVSKNVIGVVISVSDNGPGIDISFQKHVFEKFAQSKSKLTRRVGGTGLGLAIVKHIVEIHKAKVMFDTSTDKNNHGTVFKIILKNL